MLNLFRLLYVVGRKLVCLKKVIFLFSFTLWMPMDPEVEWNTVDLFKFQVVCPIIWTPNLKWPLLWWQSLLGGIQSCLISAQIELYGTYSQPGRLECCTTLVKVESPLLFNLNCLCLSFEFSHRHPFIFFLRASYSSHFVIWYHFCLLLADSFHSNISILLR